MINIVRALAARKRNEEIGKAVPTLAAIAFVLTIVFVHLTGNFLVAAGSMILLIIFYRLAKR